MLVERAMLFRNLHRWGLSVAQEIFVSSLVEELVSTSSTSSSATIPFLRTPCGVLDLSAAEDAMPIFVVRNPVELELERLQNCAVACR